MKAKRHETAKDTKKKVVVEIRRLERLETTNLAYMDGSRAW
jgi:hypothetical protein